MVGKTIYAENNRVLNEMLAEKKHLIAVHRGSWGGNIIQSTVGAYKASRAMGADMVEADVNSSTDGVLYAFHDGHEPEILGIKQNIKTMDSATIDSYYPINSIGLPSSHKVNRLEMILDYLPEGLLLNIDRAWDIFPKVLAMLDRYKKALTQVVLKAPLKEIAAFEALQAHETKYMFMPICYSIADVDRALSYEGINVVGAELIAPKPEDELFSDEAIAYVHGKGLYCWVNAITLGDVERDGLYGGLDDDISILESPDLGWGKLFEKKIDVLQTDWPALLYAYRTRYLKA